MKEPPWQWLWIILNLPSVSGIQETNSFSVRNVSMALTLFMFGLIATLLVVISIYAVLIGRFIMLFVHQSLIQIQIQGQLMVIQFILIHWVDQTYSV